VRNVWSYKSGTDFTKSGISGYGPAGEIATPRRKSHRNGTSGRARIGRSDNAATASVSPPPWLTPVIASRLASDLFPPREQLERANASA
jgi:hypothetical protein